MKKINYNPKQKSTSSQNEKDKKQINPVNNNYNKYDDPECHGFTKIEEPNKSNSIPMIVF